MSKFTGFQSHSIRTRKFFGAINNFSLFASMTERAMKVTKESAEILHALEHVLLTKNGIKNVPNVKVKLNASLN